MLSSSATTSARERTQEKQTAACPLLDSRMSDCACALSQKEHCEVRGLLRPVVNGHPPTLIYATWLRHFS